MECLVSLFGLSFWMKPELNQTFSYESSNHQGVNWLNFIDGLILPERFDENPPDESSHILRLMTWDVHQQTAQN